MLTLCKSANIINNAESFGCPPEILGSGADKLLLTAFFICGRGQVKKRGVYFVLFIDFRC